MRVRRCLKLRRQLSLSQVARWLWPKHPALYLEVNVTKCTNSSVNGGTSCCFGSYNYIKQANVMYVAVLMGGDCCLVPSSVEGCVGLLRVAGATPVSTRRLACLPAKHNFKAIALCSVTRNQVAKVHDIKLERQWKKKERNKKKEK
jgi:hypothetical protein